MLTHITILLCGFSIFSALTLIIAYLFFLPDMHKSVMGKVSAFILLSGLVGLQTAHYLFVIESIPLLEHRSYGMLLLCIPVAFFFFSRVVLFIETEPKLIDSLHLLPASVGLFLPIHYLAPLGFIIGSAYTLWFAQRVLKLRQDSQRFRFEVFFFSLFAVIALIALALCLSLPYIKPDIFYLTYANVISGCMFLIIGALLFYPKLLSDILLITELAYSNSKLEGINISDKLQILEKLMAEDRLYQNESLSLSLLAEQMELSPHQLSELINTQFETNFPRYIREQRVKRAKQLLIQEPDTSILAISMETGFKSQSNFYTAFKEISGISPGQYRKNSM